MLIGKKIRARNRLPPHLKKAPYAYGYSVNAARKKLFAKKGKSIENIPPSLDALIQHSKGAVLQAGFVWSQSLIPNPTLPRPHDWG